MGVYLNSVDILWTTFSKKTTITFDKKNYVRYKVWIQKLSIFLEQKCQRKLAKKRPNNLVNVQFSLIKLGLMKHILFQFICRPPGCLLRSEQLVCRSDTDPRTRRWIRSDFHVACASSEITAMKRWNQWSKCVARTGRLPVIDIQRSKW